MASLRGCLRSSLVAAAIAWALPACAADDIGPPPPPPVSPLAESPAPPPADAAAGMILDLDAAIEQALESNFGLRIARHDLASAQSSLVAERNDFDFKLTTRYQDTRDFARNQAFDLLVSPGPPEIHRLFFRDVLTDDQRLSLTLDRRAEWGGTFSLETDLTRSHDIGHPLHESTTLFTYRQPLFAGRGRALATAGLVGARTALRDRSRSLAADEMRLVVDVVRAFFQVVRSKKFIVIDQDAVDRASENLRTYRVRLEEGLITPIDVARAESEWRSRQEVVVGDEEEWRSARDHLAYQLGLPVGTDIETQAPEETALEPLEIDLAAAIKEAQDNRVELRNERDAVDLAKLATKVAASGILPHVDIAFSAGTSTISGDQPSSYLKLDQRDTWIGGVDVSYTFGERSDDEAYLRARIDEASTKLRLEDLQRSVELEVRDSVRAIRSLERRIELLRQNVDLAKESLRLASLQLEEDLIRTTDLLQIQADLVRAQTDLAGAIADHEVARVNLDLVLGRYRTNGLERPSTFLRPLPAIRPDVGPAPLPLPLPRRGPAMRRQKPAAGAVQ